MTDQVRLESAAARRPSATPADVAPSTMSAGHFFVLTTALLVGGTAIVLRQQSAPVIVLAGFTVAAAGYAAYALYRSVLPLVSGEGASDVVMIGGRTRAALERDKALTLRSLKELDFDHKMGKIAAADYTEMRERLRARAVRLMRQLDGATAYRAQIERDLQTRLGPAVPVTHAGPVLPVTDAHRPSTGPGPTQLRRVCEHCNASNDADARFCKACGTAMPKPRPTCSECGTVGEVDARFCKHCGHALLAPV